MRDYVGTTIGGCKVLKKIGQGGMGMVYEAEQASLQRRVAIKILIPQLAGDTTFVTRFLREARSVGGLSHPNILEVYDAGFSEETAYMVTELIRGQTLAQLVREKGLFGEAEALSIARDIASALAEAADHHLVHRDLKPGNVMVTEKGMIKVMDFGLAKRLLADAETVTQTGAIVGTPQYMSPEQIQGSDVDARSDIYSLGLVLFFLTTGKPAYGGDSLVGILHDQVYTPLPDPRTLNPKLSEPVRLLILRMTKKNRADRFQTPKDVVEAIGAVQKQIEAPGSGPGQPEGQPTGRSAWQKRLAAGRFFSPRGYGAAAGLGALLLAAVFVSTCARRGEQAGAEGEDGATHIVLRWDTNGVITFMNRHGLETFGYAREDLLGKPLIGTIVPRAESTGRDLAGLIREIQSRPEDFRENVNQNIRSDGSLIWVRWRNRAVLDSGSRLAEIVSIGSKLDGAPKAGGGAPPEGSRPISEYFSEGNHLLGLKKWDEAIAVFEAAQRSHPTSPDPGQWLAMARERRAAASQRGLAAELLTPGKLVVLAAPYSRFYHEDDQGLTSGYDLDLLRPFAARHGLTLELIRLPESKDLIPELVAGKADLLASGITITDARQKWIDFSVPYFGNCQVVVAKKASRIDDPGDLDGKTLGFVQGTTHEGTARDMKKAIPSPRKDYEALVNALLKGEIDAFVDDMVDAVAACRQNPSMGVAFSLENLESFGFGLRKGTPHLKEALNAFLKEAEAKGFLKELYSKHFESDL